MAAARSQFAGDMDCDDRELKDAYVDEDGWHICVGHKRKRETESDEDSNKCRPSL